MTEKQMRRRVVAKLKERGLDPISVENSVRSGTPDVNYVNGWVELKTLPAWPVREDTPVRIEHFTPQQRVWLRRRCEAPNGNAWLLLEIDNTWFLFWGTTAATRLGTCTRKELYRIAIHTAHRPEKSNWDVFCEHLVEGRS